MPKVKRNICNRNNTRRVQKQVAKEEKEEKSVVPHLNNDVTANILTRIPADLLHMNYRFQCKDWSDILSVPNFIHANIIHAKPGLIFGTSDYDAEDDTKVGFLELEEGLKPKVRQLSIFKGRHMQFLSSCNGLVLVKEGNWHPHALSILNPTTKEIIGIPPCKHACCWHELVYLTASKEYKLVDMFTKGSKSTPIFHVRSMNGLQSYCVRVPFRDVTIYCSYNSLSGGCWWNERIAVDGVVYVNTGRCKKLLTFDLCSESVQLLEVPASGEAVRLIELNGSVSFVDCVGTCGTNCPLEVWVLMDKITRKWEKRYRIDTLPRQLYLWYRILGSLDNGRRFVFAWGSEIFVYDINTRQWSFQISPLAGNCYFKFCPRVHVNSLAQIRD